MSKKEEPLLKPPRLDDIDPNTAPAHSSNLKLVSRSTMIKERALEGLFLVCACVAVLAVLLIFVFTLWKAMPVLSDIGILSFFGLTWAPTRASRASSRRTSTAWHETPRSYTASSASSSCGPSSPTPRAAWASVPSQRGSCSPS